jgi:glycosyltransferase involved in cell wall biosynthesis
MSAVIIRALAAGKPLIISDNPHWRIFPDDFCWRVPAGAQEATVLTDYLKKLRSNPALQKTMGHKARDYYLEHHTIEGMALNYISLIKSVIDSGGA